MVVVFYIVYMKGDGDIWVIGKNSSELIIGV